MFSRFVLPFVMAFALISPLVGCNALMPHDHGMDSSVHASQGHGNMKIMMVGGAMALQKQSQETPDDSPVLSDAQIRVVEIRVHSVDGDLWYGVPVDPFDLNPLTLAKGLGEVLARIRLPLGAYDQIRLVLASEGSIRVDGQPVPLIVPSGTRSGLKLHFNPPIKVTSCALSVALLELDIQKSFHAAGHGGSRKVLFKPSLQIRSIQPLLLDGSSCSSGTADEEDSETPDTETETEETDPDVFVSDPPTETTDPANDDTSYIDPPVDSDDSGYIDPFVIGV